jgi:hypothetical protein
MNSSKAKVKVERLVWLRSHYYAMYRVYMMRLFDEFHISDPTVYSEGEIIKGIAEMGISRMFSNSGRVSLSYDQAKFAYYKATDEVEKSFLYSLMNMLLYRNYCNTIDKIYEDCGFRSAQKARIRLGMCIQHSKVTVKNGVEFNAATANCMTTFDYEVKSININEFIWGLAMAELGIPQEDWNKDSLFVDGLSHSQEVECAKGILNGDFVSKGGKYTSLLTSWLKSHPWGDNRKTVDSKGLYDYIFAVKCEELLSVFKSLFELLNKDKDSELLGVYESSIYYAEPREEFCMPMGTFQVLNGAGSDELLLSQSFALGGMTGEFYNVERLEEDGIGYVGCPMWLSNSKENILVYDREQTDVVFDTWYQYNGAIFNFDESVSMPKNPFTYGSLPHTIYDGFVRSLMSVDGLTTTVRVSRLEDLEKAKKEVCKFIEGVLK